MEILDPTSWVGHTETCMDSIDACHAERVALSLNDVPPVAGEALPPLWHWAFFVRTQPYAALGEDGHPQRGGFLPLVENRNRMWAGGRLEFLQPLVVDAVGERRSTVAKVVEKEGRSGKLLFVTVMHEYSQNGVLCISEEQDIVYREPSPPVLVGTRPAPEPEWSETVEPGPVMLFRYSAVTFNGHRIHYDAPYVKDVEGYPGLVVHGPLIATLMLKALMHAQLGKKVAAMSYRGLRPLISPRAFQVAGRCESPKSALLWASQDDTLAHWAEVQFSS